MRILMILIADTDPDYRSQDQGASELVRFAMAYYLFQGANIDVMLASRDGGAPWGEPIDLHGGDQPETLKRFKADRSAREELSDTLRFDQVDVLDFDAAFCVGAPCATWNAADLASSAALIANFLRHGKPVVIASGILDCQTARNNAPRIGSSENVTEIDGGGCWLDLSGGAE